MDLNVAVSTASELFEDSDMVFPILMGRDNLKILASPGSESSGVSSLDAEEAKKLVSEQLTSSSSPTLASGSTSTVQTESESSDASSDGDDDKPHEQSPAETEQSADEQEQRSDAGDDNATKIDENDAKEMSAIIDGSDSSGDIDSARLVTVDAVKTDDTASFELDEIRYKNLKIIYDGRDILDFGANTANKSWSLQYTKLPQTGNWRIFINNRSQYHRLRPDWASSSEHEHFALSKCPKCAFQFPVLEDAAPQSTDTGMSDVLVNRASLVQNLNALAQNLSTQSMVSPNYASTGQQSMNNFMSNNNYGGLGVNGNNAAGAPGQSYPYQNQSQNRNQFGNAATANNNHAIFNARLNQLVNQIGNNNNNNTNNINNVNNINNINNASVFSSNFMNMLNATNNNTNNNHMHNHNHSHSNNTNQLNQLSNAALANIMNQNRQQQLYGAPPDSPFHPAHIQHLMQSNSVTLSPAPSVDSQGRSSPQQEVLQQQAQAFQQNASTSAGSSHQSDSDEDSYSEKPQIKAEQHQSSPPLTPLCKDSASLSLSQQISNVVNSWSMHQENFGSSSGLSSGSSSAPTTPCNFAPVKREFFPDTPEPNTNGRLLWDFLQQLLNDQAQRYSNFIAWKCRETGVFKIIDPAGLAKLWGIQKNHLSMNYDKMSRALRYYYRVNILRKVQGERHCYQFLRNPTELKSIKNISLLRQQPPPAPASSNQTINNKPTENTHNNLSNGNGQMGAHLNVQSLIHQQQAPPSSPRVHALNGAFHYLSTTSNVPDRSSPPQSHSSSQSDMDDQPTDLSTSGRTSNPDCYPLIRNSNGLTTIRLIQPNSPQSQQMDDYPSHNSDKGDRSSPMATDLRKME